MMFIGVHAASLAWRQGKVGEGEILPRVARIQAPTANVRGRCASIGNDGVFTEEVKAILGTVMVQ